GRNCAAGWAELVVQEGMYKFVWQHTCEPGTVRQGVLRRNRDAPEHGIEEPIGPQEAAGRALKRGFGVQDDDEGLRRKVPELLADLSIGLFKNLQHSGPRSLFGFPVEFHGKVCTVSAG